MSYLVNGKRRTVWAQQVAFSGDLRGTYRVVGKEGEWTGDTVVVTQRGTRMIVTTEHENGEKRQAHHIREDDMVRCVEAKMNLHYGELEMV